MIRREMAGGPRADDREALAVLRAGLVAAGFTVEGIEERLGTTELSLRPLDAAVHVRRLGDDAFGTIARAFLLAVPVDANRLADALVGADLDRLAALGVL